LIVPSDLQRANRGLAVEISGERFTQPDLQQCGAVALVVRLRFSALNGDLRFDVLACAAQSAMARPREWIDGRSCPLSFLWIAASYRSAARRSLIASLRPTTRMLPHRR
jgi:hypothetical protein